MQQAGSIRNRLFLASHLDKIEMAKGGEVMRREVNCKASILKAMGRYVPRADYAVPRGGSEEIQEVRGTYQTTLEMVARWIVLPDHRKQHVAVRLEQACNLSESLWIAHPASRREKA